MPKQAFRLDDLDDREVLALRERLHLAWAPRDQLIREMDELREHTWQVKVPRAWARNAPTRHTSLSREIPTRIAGTVTLRDPQFSRPNPGERFDKALDANQVERWTLAHFQHWRRKALKGLDAWHVAVGHLANKGGVLGGSILRPHDWANGPLFLDEAGEPKRTYWRDSAGKETDDRKAMDLEATTRAYQRAVDGHRRLAGSPIKRRIFPAECAYPMIQEDQMPALFVRRKTTLVELRENGFVLDIVGADGAAGSTQDLWEVWTERTCKYFLKDQRITHDKWGDTLEHDYGFVPWTYSTGIIGNLNDYGGWGIPALALVEANIRLIVTLRTYLMGAVHAASFTSWFVKYLGDLQAQMNDPNKRVNKWDVVPGTVMDFGPGREIAPLLHPGLNPDFWKALRDQEAEIERVFPRTLSGVPTSSGYNTAVTTVNAKSILGGCYTGAERLLEGLAEMDMRHIAALGGPVYLEAEEPRSVGSSRKPELSHVMLDRKTIGGYFAIRASIDREVDRVTMGAAANNLYSAGVVDKQYVRDQAGVVDGEDMVKRQAMDKVLDSPEFEQWLMQDAISALGLEDMAAEAAAAAQRLQFDPTTGIPLVSRDGQQVAPGRTPLPSAQGMAGRQGGLTGNPALQSNGGPNLPSTANPSIGTARPTPSGRDRGRRRGGRLPGQSSRPPHRPTPQNPAT